MGEPPLFAGAVNDTIAEAELAVAKTARGAPGTVGATDGTTLLEAADAGLVPMALVAVTVKVKAEPFIRPLTKIGDVVPVTIGPPGRALTV